jgi:hypothetical protein
MEAWQVISIVLFLEENRERPKKGRFRVFQTCLFQFEIEGVYCIFERQCQLDLLPDETAFFFSCACGYKRQPSSK